MVNETAEKDTYGNDTYISKFQSSNANLTTNLGNIQ